VRASDLLPAAQRHSVGLSIALGLALATAAVGLAFTGYPVLAAGALGAGGFVVFAQLAEARDNAPAMILGLFLATWSYVLSVAGTVLLASWWFWKWHHMRTAHALRPC